MHAKRTHHEVVAAKYFEGIGLLLGESGIAGCDVCGPHEPTIAVQV